MRIFKRAILFLCCEIAVSVYLYYYAGYKFSDIIHSPLMFLIFPTIANLLGLILGLLLYLIVQYSRIVKSFFLLGLNLSFLVFFMVAIHFAYISWQTNTRYGYNAETQMLMKLGEEQKPEFLYTAFELFQSKIKKPRNLFVKTTWFDSDTILTSKGDTIHSIYFEYTLDPNRITDLFAKVIVLDGHAECPLFNIDPRDNVEISKIKSQMDKDEMVQFNKFMELLPDSLKKVISNSIKSP